MSPTKLDAFFIWLAHTCPDEGEPQWCLYEGAMTVAWIEWGLNGGQSSDGA